MMKKYVPIFLFALMLSSCGEYQKVLKSDDFNYKYAKAVSYYEDADFNRALPLFSELTTIMMGTSKMEEVSYYYAYCHYSTGENVMAAHLFKNYAINYPNSKHTQECSYMGAYCYYLESPNYSLDATNNYKAIKALDAQSSLEHARVTLDELAVSNDWDPEEQTVMEFMEMVKPVNIFANPGKLLHFLIWDA